ncbi:ribonuclease H-like domain-containing protein [Tanacetum coccineum]
MNFYMAVLKSHTGWKSKDFRGMTFEQIEEKFIPFWKQLQDFVPMNFKTESERVKRPGIQLAQESSKRLKTAKASGSEPSQEHQTKDSKELFEEELKKMMEIVPVEEVYIEALQAKYPIIEWEIYSEEQRKYWKIIRVGNHTEVYQTFEEMLKSTTDPTEDKEKELWVELKRLYKPDPRDHLWALQRYMHDPLEWRLYDTCGVHHVSTERGHEIFMLVEKDYPLTKGLTTLLLCNKLQSIMADPASPDHLPASPDHALVEIEEDQDMDIDEEDLEEDQKIDFEDEEDKSSSAAPDASHLVGRPLLVVASRVALHHQEIRTSQVRAYRIESIQTRLRRSEQVIKKDIGWLRERLDVIQARALSLIDVLELRYREDNYPREQVDALRVEVDGLHHEENRANAAGAARPAGARARAARLTGAGVARPIGARAGTAGPVGGVARGNVAPEIHKYTYKSFLKYNLYTLSGIEGKVGLSRWFEKLELVFCISGCADESIVKVATYILQGRALTCYNVPYNGYPEYKKIELYIWGLLEKIQGNVPFSKPATTYEAICIAHNLMDQKVSAKAARGSDGNKQKSKTAATDNNLQPVVTCYVCVEKGHYKNRCPKRKDQQAEGADKSFVSSTFSTLIDIAPSTLDTSYDVELVDGKVIPIKCHILHKGLKVHREGMSIVSGTCDEKESCRETFKGLIMEYLVKISKKARILELDQRHMKKLILTSYTSYPSRKIRRISAYTLQETTKTQRSIRHIQKESICCHTLT